MRKFIIAIISFFAALPIFAQDTALADPRLEGEWLLSEINGEKVTGDERPYLTFDLGRAMLYGCNGNNVVNAFIDCPADNEIAFAEIKIGTNAQATDGYLFDSMLAAARYYKITVEGNEFLLELQDSANRQLMTLRKHNMDFLNGLWTVVEIDDEVVDNPELQLVIDLPLKHLHGRTGCNVVNGEIFIDPAKSNHITFRRLLSTRRMCPDINTETRLLVALEEVESASVSSATHVSLLDKHGRRVLLLRRQL